MVAYLDALDAAPEPPPAGSACIAALGPKMLELSRDRARRRAPVPRHRRAHRARARGGRRRTAPRAGAGASCSRPTPTRRAGWPAGPRLYLALPNYVNNWQRLGFADETRDGGSDRLVDALVAWGDEDAIAARVPEHLEAGADHVCMQVIHGEDGLPLGSGGAWRTR